MRRIASLFFFQGSFSRLHSAYVLLLSRDPDPRMLILTFWAHAVFNVCSCNSAPISLFRVRSSLSIIMIIIINVSVTCVGWVGLIAPELGRNPQVQTV